MPASVRKDDIAKKIAIDILGEPTNSKVLKKRKKTPKKKEPEQAEQFSQFENIK